MPSFDDRSEFPPSRRGRPARAPRSRRDGSAQDWRHPDPGERYSQDYEEFANPRSQDSDAEEWQHSPAAQDSFASFERLQRRETFEDDSDWDRAGSGWNEQAGSDDPFNWDAPEPPEEPGWRDDTFGRGSYMPMASSAIPLRKRGWDEETPGTSRRPALSDPEPQGGACGMTACSGASTVPFRTRILSALTERATRDADPFAGDPERDPAELGDRFFARTAEFDEAQAATTA